MAHQLARSFSVLWLLIITMMVPCFGSDDLATATETSVAIQNLLEDQDNLTVHCQSVGADTGVQNLTHGQHFKFHFLPNISSVFNCTFSWSDGVCRRFDIYEEDSDDMFTDIQWQIYKDGPCMFAQDDDLYYGDDDDDDDDEDSDDDDHDICFEWSDVPC